MRRTGLVLVVALVTVIVDAGPLASISLAQSAVEKRFDQLDRNKDGEITPNELPATAFFKRLDLDGDGAITKSEATKALRSGALNDLLKPAPAPPAPETAKPTEPTPAAAPVRQGPQPVKPGDHGVGRLVADLSFVDLTGKSHQLKTLTDKGIVVFAMTSTSCPLSKKYLPTLVELTQTFGDTVCWILVNPVATDKVSDMQTAANLFNGKIIYVHDKTGELAHHVGALTTTDGIVLDRSRTIVYHGAVDDQYGFGYSIETPRYRYLADALTALLAGKSPLVAATKAPGCTIEPVKKSALATKLTYHNRISRIVQQHCVECHRDGGVAPFALDTYDDLVAHAGMVQEVIEGGIMPPWFAAGSTSKDSGADPVSPWVNDRSLADAEKQDLLTWIASSKPEGDRQDAPQPRTFDEDWLIGKPDAVFQFPRPVPIKATGVMPYQYILVDTKLPEDKWVQAIEVRPGDRSVVHHVLVFVTEGNDADDAPWNDAAAERSGFWGIYVPGNSTLVYPEGFAKRLPKGARLRFQMHYTPNGTATTDRTSIGLIWAKEPPEHEIRVAGIVNARINIPPGADNHREEAVLRLPMDATITGYLPHMHLRGKACRYEVVRTNGETATLLDIPRYDFNWQLLYRYLEPLSLQAGDTLRFTVWYDNSAKNPANPDPNKTVRWGAQTFDEMHLGYVEYYIPGATPGESPGLPGRRRLGGGRPAVGATGFNLEAIFNRLDRNSDGKLIGDEIPAGLRDRLLQLDTDQDGAITLEKRPRNCKDKTAVNQVDRH